MWGLEARESRYSGPVSEPEGQERQKEQVEMLRRMLEAELDRRLKPQWGCWPLLVGILGVLLGIALLVENF
jgi:hypothetical protein